MPVNEEKNQQAWEVGDMIRNAAGLVENAIKVEDAASKKALRDAAKALLKAATDRLDESVGTSIDEEDD